LQKGKTHQGGNSKEETMNPTNALRVAVTYPDCDPVMGTLLGTTDGRCSVQLDSEFSPNTVQSSWVTLATDVQIAEAAPKVERMDRIRRIASQYHINKSGQEIQRTFLELGRATATELIEATDSAASTETIHRLIRFLRDDGVEINWDVNSSGDTSYYMGPKTETCRKAVTNVAHQNDVLCWMKAHVDQWFTGADVASGLGLSPDKDTSVKAAWRIIRSRQHDGFICERRLADGGVLEFRMKGVING
jgi:hypothetical protein